MQANITICGCYRAKREEIYKDIASTSQDIPPLRDLTLVQVQFATADAFLEGSDLPELEYILVQKPIYGALYDSEIVQAIMRHVMCSDCVSGIKINTKLRHADLVIAEVTEVQAVDSAIRHEH